MNTPADYPSHWKRRCKTTDRFAVCLSPSTRKVWVRVPGGSLAFTIDRDKLPDLIEQLQQYVVEPQEKSEKN